MPRGVTDRVGRRDEMTLLPESKMAVKRAGTFLLDLLDKKKTPRVPPSIRDEARRVLRHYPVNIEIDTLFEPHEKKRKPSILS